MAREYHGRRRSNYRLSPADQALLDRLAGHGQNPTSAAHALGMTVAAVNALAHGGMATEGLVDRMGEALARWRDVHERRAS